MKFLKDNWLLILLAIIIIIGSTVGGGAFKYLNEENRELQHKIDSNQSVIKNLKLRNESLFQFNKDSRERELRLLDELKTSKGNKEKIEKYYEERYDFINTSSDSLYLQYLRARISDTH